MELLTDAHFWVGVAFIAFLVILVLAGVHKLAWNALGAAGDKVRAQLDEANRLREEAEALLARIKSDREAAEHYCRREGVPFEVRGAPQSGRSSQPRLTDQAPPRLCCWPTGPHARCCGQYPAALKSAQGSGMAGGGMMASSHSP